MSAYSTGCVNLDRPYTIYHGEVCVGRETDFFDRCCCGPHTIVGLLWTLVSRRNLGCRKQVLNMAPCLAEHAALFKSCGVGVTSCRCARCI